MVSDGVDFILFEKFLNLLDALDGGRVDDGAAVFKRPKRIEQNGFLFGARTFTDKIAEIGAIEAGDVFERIAEAELADDVVPDVLRGAGGKSGDG